MPIITINPIGIPVPPFGSTGSTLPNATPAGIIVTIIYPVQWVGFVPLTCCSSPAPGSRDPDTVFSNCDCRTWTDDDCYISPVFASLTDTNVLKNDKSSFLLEYPFYYQYLWNNNSNSAFTLQEWNGSSWFTIAQLNSNAYGTYYNFGALCIENLKGYLIDWRKVLIAFGEGLYRIKITSQIYFSATCLVSEPFCLKEWSCARVDKTVRWEAYIEGGRIGSITDEKKIFVFCCEKKSPDGGLPTGIVPVTWYDSIRTYGFFGYEKSAYERINYEWNDGTINQHKNEIIQSFEFHSAMLPKWWHDRFKTYGNMADRLYVSDFNMSNSDYDVKQKIVVCDGAYEPEYTLLRGENRTRLAPVKVNYKEGIQNVIRDKCCGTPKAR